MPNIPTPNPTSISPSCPTTPGMAFPVIQSNDEYAQPISLYVNVSGNTQVVPANAAPGTVVDLSTVAGTVVPFRVRAVLLADPGDLVGFY